MTLPLEIAKANMGCSHLLSQGGGLKNKETNVVQIAIVVNVWSDVPDDDYPQGVRGPPGVWR